MTAREELEAAVESLEAEVVIQRREIAALTALSKDQLYVAAKDLQAPYELVAEIADTGTLPVVLFVALGTVYTGR